MILTSYFAKYRAFPADKEPVCIARWAPKATHYPVLMHLAPSLELLKSYKQSLINEQQYTEQFNEQLSRLDPKQVGEELEGKILLCYEKTGSFCHRHLVAEWLRNAGFIVKELE